MKKQLFSILLVLVMVIGMMPVTSFAADNGSGSSTTEDFGTFIDGEQVITDMIEKHGLYAHPRIIMTDEKFAKLFLARYEVIYLYKFREPTYQQFQQCIAFVRKKDSAGFTSEELEGHLKQCEELKPLPGVCDQEPIVVNPSVAKDLSVFKCRKFNAMEWIEDVENEHSLDNHIGKWLGTRVYSDVITQRPPIVLGDSHLAMMATCGKGAGAVGCEEDGDYHLQRGSVKRAETERTEMKNGKLEVVVTNHASINIKILEQVKGDDGRPMAKFTDLV